MQKTKTNKKISRSLKRYHKKKRVLEIAKTLTAWLFLVIIPSVTILVALTPTPLVNAKARHTSFPQAEDRTDIRLVNAEKIRIIAKEEGFKWTKYLVNMACHEGWLEENTINDKGNTPANSIDRGLYGINNYWHSEVSDECAFDLGCATRWTIGRINAGFQGEWMADAFIKGKPNYINKCL